VTKENQLLENMEIIKTLDEDYQHEYTSDSRGRPLDGSKFYRLHLLPDIFKSSFWSVIVYDSLTKLIIQNDQLWPSLHTNSRKLDVNPDGSVDIRFGPAARKEKALNWLQTIPGKDWYIVLRIYNAPDLCFAQGWNPGDIEEILT
jgi:hypothetical protein